MKIKQIDLAMTITKILQIRTFGSSCSKQRCIVEKRQAIRLMDEIRRKDDAKLFYSAGKNPMGFLATILYLSCLKTGENKIQVEFAEAAGMTFQNLK